MTSKEFINTCISAGYASKTQAQSYIDSNPKDDYSTEDFVNVSRIGEITHHSPLASGYVANGRKSNSSGFKS